MSDYRRFSSRARAPLIPDDDQDDHGAEEYLSPSDTSDSFGSEHDLDHVSDVSGASYISYASDGSEEYVSDEEDAWGSRPKRKKSTTKKKTKTEKRKSTLTRKRPVKSSGIVSDESEESFDDEGSDGEPRTKRVVFDGTIPFPSSTSEGTQHHGNLNKLIFDRSGREHLGQ